MMQTRGVSPTGSRTKAKIPPGVSVSVRDCEPVSYGDEPDGRTPAVTGIVENQERDVFLKRGVVESDIGHLEHGAFHRINGGIVRF